MPSDEGVKDFKRGDEVWIRGKVMDAYDNNPIYVAPYCVSNSTGTVGVYLEDIRHADAAEHDRIRLEALESLTDPIDPTAAFSFGQNIAAKCSDLLRYSSSQKILSGIIDQELRHAIRALAESAKQGSPAGPNPWTACPECGNQIPNHQEWCSVKPEAPDDNEPSPTIKFICGCYGPSSWPMCPKHQSQHAPVVPDFNTEVAQRAWNAGFKAGRESLK